MFAFSYTNGWGLTGGPMWNGLTHISNFFWVRHDTSLWNYNRKLFANVHQTASFLTLVLFYILVKLLDEYLVMCATWQHTHICLHFLFMCESYFFDVCDGSELSELAKQYVLRILFVEQPVTQTVMTAWMTNQYNRYFCSVHHPFWSHVFHHNVMWCHSWSLCDVIVNMIRWYKLCTLTNIVEFLSLIFIYITIFICNFPSTWILQLLHIYVYYAYYLCLVVTVIYYLTCV